MGLLKVASKVRTAVLNSPKLSALSASKTKLLKAFLEDPADYYDQKAQAKASYSPQSATVIGILKDMYDTFAADLEKSNQDESNAQKGFEDVIAEKKQLLEATQAQLKEDEEFFATARTSCKDKSDSWDERSRLRTEELSGINKALEILTSDDAR